MQVIVYVGDSLLARVLVGLRKKKGAVGRLEADDKPTFFSFGGYSGYKKQTAFMQIGVWPIKAYYFNVVSICGRRA